MTRFAGLRAALQLMRPAQWPILSGQLAVGMALAAPLAGPGRNLWWHELDWPVLGAAWLAWVVLLNGGTLAFNSAYDRDTGPVAYLSRPPAPPRWLAGAALGAMGLGALLGVVAVGWFFGLVVLGSVVLSVLYSHPGARWKSRPGLDLLTNMLGYGLGTTLAGLSAAAGGPPPAGSWWFAAGFGLLFGSFYPLTQIYQAAEDHQRGDRTLTTALGVRRALQLSVLLGVMAAAALLRGCRYSDGTAVLAAALVLWCGHLVWWLVRGVRWSDAAHERGMYRALVLWGVVDLALAGVWLA